MTSRELVRKTMMGENTGITPIYGWVKANLKEQIAERFGSAENFEDQYEFDMAHIFGGPYPFGEAVHKLKQDGTEVTPQVLLDIPLERVDDMNSYSAVVDALAHHKKRGRFCYQQTPGIFECLNAAFGIENHLAYLLLYPDELKEVYSRQAKWNIEYAKNVIELGVDGLLVSDDWGSQRSLMFSLDTFYEMIYPHHKLMAQTLKKYDILLGMHCDGCATPALDGIADIGYDFIHPWQENAEMPYSIYLEKYSDKFGILGGLCVQSTLGFGDYDRLESEIRRVFGLLKGKRWAFCTTHSVQSHCSVDELVFAYDLAYKLAHQRV